MRTWSSRKILQKKFKIIFKFSNNFLKIPKFPKNKKYILKYFFQNNKFNALHR